MDCSPPGSSAHGIFVLSQEYWNGWLFPPPGDLPHPGIKPTSLEFPVLAGRFFTTESPGKPRIITRCRRRQWHPTLVLLPGKSHGRRSLVGCSPWGREESDTTERLHFHFSLSCIGKGNGNPLQCSCLENPRDGGAWWAAVYGVVQSRTRLKQLNSSSSSRHMLKVLIHSVLQAMLARNGTQCFSILSGH